jgi:FdhD protein
MGDERPETGESKHPVELSWPGRKQVEDWGVATEVAVEINVNDVPLAVMMATPSALEDLAVGFAFTENVLVDPKGVQAVDANKFADGWIVNLVAEPESVNDSARRARMLEGRAGCGLCGVDTLAAAMRRPVMRVAPGSIGLEDVAFRRAFVELPSRQPLNQLTHSVHAAAWCSVEGDILAVREDVGRHNALDKLVGWQIRSGEIQDNGFVVMSSRVSYELVCKAAAMGASALAATSAPTSLALDLAARADLELVFLGPDNAIVRFTP